MKFKESELAHEYCKGKGVEIGGAAHNPFGLEDCINIAPVEDEKFFGDHQEELCGERLKIDKYGTADKLPIDNNSIDYIVSSHVLEHVPDVIGAFLEWNRVLKKDGVIFIIVPERNALESDRGRPLTPIDGFLKAHTEENKGKVDTDNHIWVFSLELLCELIEACNHEYKLDWEILEADEIDDKVGNGHTVVCRRK